MTDHSSSSDGFDPTDPIMTAWAAQDEDAGHLGSTDLGDIADSVAKAHRKDQRWLLWLNAQEFLPSILVSGGFLFAVPNAVRPMAVVASSMIVLGTGLFLVISSVRHHRADRRWNSSMRDQLARRLAQVSHRAWLYRHVGTWYILPLLFAIVLFRFGTEDSFYEPEGELLFWGLLLGVNFVLYLINRWIGRSKYETEVERLQSLLAEFDAKAPPSAPIDPTTD